MEGDGRTLEVAGGYSDYQRYRRGLAAPAPRGGPADDKPRSRAEAPKPRKTTKLSYKDQRELDRLPARIDALTAEAAVLEQRLADPALYKKSPAGFDEITRALAAKRRELAAAEERWLELEAEREALESGKGESGKASNGEFAP